MSRLAQVLLAVAALIGLVVGWRAFWFLCDDAFIEFRYVANVHKGLGFVWNAPPFSPVEGYTSFLWVALLEGVWRLTGAEPPESAPWLSLGLSAGTVLLVVAAAVRLPLAASWEPYRPWVAAGVLVSTLTNRTFLTWTSSGLETSLWTFVFALWAFAAVYLRAPDVVLVGLAALAALVRPDGLLLVATSAAFVAARAWRDRKPAQLVAWLPIAAVVAHLLWRHHTYGWWLPNTYYAKHVGPWPLMGVAYVTSFVVEFAYWPQVVLLGLASWAAVRARAVPDVGDPVVLGLGTIALHWAYYTFDVGGDHFEYRVYQHLVPVLALASPVLAGRAGWSVRRASLAFVAAWLLGLVIPWTHYAATYNWPETHTSIKDRKGSFRLPMVWRVPLPFAPYAYAWDGLQLALNSHFVCIRWHGHRTYLEYQKDRWHMVHNGALPDLKGDIGVLPHTSIGWPAWKFQDWAMIDEHGLSDVAVAHSPPVHTSQFNRLMAHDHSAPKGYSACYRPNLKLTKQGVLFTPRATPLTAEEVHACEAKFGPARR